MSASDRNRITKDRLSPRIVELWRALAPLQTVVSFMNTGAHPDDETSAMLAALSLRDGVDISYACSTRGEGGQNDIGTEASEALGVLRTAEMEQACDVLGLRMYWLSTSPDDTIFDFGFSKSGIETMGKWGRDRTLARFVDILRAEKPDIICPTFLDIPGQHGHHRAMTEAAHLVMALAADANFEGSALVPWQVKKLYLPAWSGAGQAYDDDLPPPPATVSIEADGIDPVTGWSYERIAQQSRAFHLTQAMGKWVPAGVERNWPLHLVESFVEGPDVSVLSGLPHDLRDLGLHEAQDHMDAARAAFPVFETVLTEASRAFETLKDAKVAIEHAHRVVRKKQQLAKVIRLAAGAQIQARLDRVFLEPNDQTSITLEQRSGAEDRATVKLSLPDNWRETSRGVVLEGAALSDPYPPVYLPDQPMDPCVVLTLETQGVTSETRIPFEVPPSVLPTHKADLSPLSDVLNIATDRREVMLSIGETAPTDASVSFDVPLGWAASQSDIGVTLQLPHDCAEGSYSTSAVLDNHPAQTVDIIAHDHVQPRALARPATVRIEVIDAALPDVKVGYIGGGNDRVDHWLGRIGMDVTALSDDDIRSDAKLREFDSLVVGIFAMKFRDGLSAQMPRLHKWVSAGGTLLTLYHRPWDNWDAETTAPARLEIGQPSLRWRVTDENADVTHLTDHPVLMVPNEISEQDWAGWQKERGLYFAKSWGPEYEPLLEMADADEAPHRGALLSADIGAGRHTHCALILHHQMENLVPGAFRLMANLLEKRH